MHSEVRMLSITQKAWHHMNSWLFSDPRLKAIGLHSTKWIGSWPDRRSSLIGLRAHWMPAVGSNKILFLRVETVHNSTHHVSQRQEQVCESSEARTHDTSLMLIL